MPYLITRKNLKLQLSPGLVASYDIQTGNGVGVYSGDTTHTPDPRGGACVQVSDAWLRDYENRPTQFPGCMDVMQKAEKATKPWFNFMH